MRISDWSSDVCSSDLQDTRHALSACPDLAKLVAGYSGAHFVQIVAPPLVHGDTLLPIAATVIDAANAVGIGMGKRPLDGLRSEEHTSELQSLMRSSYAVFCLTKKKNKNNTTTQ